MIRWLCALVVGGILSGFAALLLTGRYINDGPVLVTLDRSHGLHVGDLCVAGGWLLGVLALVALTARSGRGAR